MKRAVCPSIRTFHMFRMGIETLLLFIYLVLFQTYEKRDYTNLTDQYLPIYPYSRPFLGLFGPFQGLFGPFERLFGLFEGVSEDDRHQNHSCVKELRLYVVVWVEGNRRDKRYMNFEGSSFYIYFNPNWYVRIDGIFYLRKMRSIQNINSFVTSFYIFKAYWNYCSTI